MLVSHRSASQSAKNQSELLDELARRVEWLCRSCPEELRAEAAQEELVEMRPRVQEAIKNLEEIEKRRPLTEEELAQRHAIRLLLSRPR